MTTKRIKKLKDTRCEALYAELHPLLQVGLDFSDAFALLIDGEHNRQMQARWYRLFDDVVAGASLAEAMERSGVFRPLECGVICIGDQTRRLIEALEFLTDYYRKRAEQRQMISAAVSYLLVILGVAAGVVAFMLAVVVPIFEQVYARMGGELPALTRAIIRLSLAFPRYMLGMMVIGGICGGILYRYIQTDAVRVCSAALLLPLIGNIVRHHYESHFCKRLYLLASCGPPPARRCGHARSRDRIVPLPTVVPDHLLRIGARRAIRRKPRGRRIALRSQTDSSHACRRGDQPLARNAPQQSAA